MYRREPTDNLHQLQEGLRGVSVSAVRQVPREARPRSSRKPRVRRRLPLSLPQVQRLSPPAWDQGRGHVIADLLRRWLIPKLNASANAMEIPDEVIRALHATPGGSLRIYYVVVPAQQENVTWWIDGSADEV